MSLKDIAKQVFLSSPAVSVRIDNLVESGYIEGFHAQINTEKMGYHIKAFINLEVSPVDKKDFYPYIKSCKNVVECNCVTGDYSMLLEVLFPSTDELDQFIGELQGYGRTNPWNTEDCKSDPVRQKVFAICYRNCKWFHRAIFYCIWTNEFNIELTRRLLISDIRKE